MTWRVVVGTISFVLMMILVGYVLLTEQSRMADFATAYASRQIEVGAAIYQHNCSPCHGVQGKGIDGVAPSLNAAEMFDGSRLESFGWSGTVEDYLLSTIASGRPRASAAFPDYPARMPTWGDEFGGPLRRDQVQAVVAFIMNWEEDALAEAAAVAPQEAEAEAAPAEAGEVGTDIAVALPPGDAVRGETLAVDQGCAGCHITASIGPGWDASGDQPGIATRAESRFTQADYAGQAASAEAYLFESIVDPGAYLVTDFPPVMPPTFGKSLSAQDVADLIAYMQTFR